MRKVIGKFVFPHMFLKDMYIVVYFGALMHRISPRQSLIDKKCVGNSIGGMRESVERQRNVTDKKRGNGEDSFSARVKKQNSVI